MPEEEPKYIELNIFLRIMVNGIPTGGQAKLIIRKGEVKVNGEVETRNKRKLHSKDVMEYLGKGYEVNDGHLR
ncbi:MAG TPA: RNA-binding S4 domain-containing protein [Candidatus Nanoarchaeia archaeon]|nr:RNA-binding S4 domain-containing protein [Candidatus Nanoarchaeia archaeon]